MLSLTSYCFFTTPRGSLHIYVHSKDHTKNIIPDFKYSNVAMLGDNCDRDIPLRSEPKRKGRRNDAQIWSQQGTQVENELDRDYGTSVMWHYIQYSANDHRRLIAAANARNGSKARQVSTQKRKPKMNAPFRVSQVKHVTSLYHQQFGSSFLLCILTESGVTVSITSSVSRTYQECLTKTK